jgi:hypothetical protein
MVLHEKGSFLRHPLDGAFVRIRQDYKIVPSNFVP